MMRLSGMWCFTVRYCTTAPARSWLSLRFLSKTPRGVGVACPTRSLNEFRAVTILPLPEAPPSPPCASQLFRPDLSESHGAPHIPYQRITASPSAGRQSITARPWHAHGFDRLEDRKVKALVRPANRAWASTGAPSERTRL